MKTISVALSIPNETTKDELIKYVSVILPDDTANNVFASFESILDMGKFFKDFTPKDIG